MSDTGKFILAGSGCIAGVDTAIATGIALAMALPMASVASMAGGVFVASGLVSVMALTLCSSGRVDGPEV